MMSAAEIEPDGALPKTFFQGIFIKVLGIPKARTNRLLDLVIGTIQESSIHSSCPRFRARISARRLRQKVAYSKTTGENRPVGPETEPSQIFTRGMTQESVADVH